MRNVWVRPVLIPLGGVAASQGANTKGMDECGHIVRSNSFGGAPCISSMRPSYSGTAVGPAS